MRLLSAIFCFLIVFARILQGEEFTTLDGEHYAGATLKRVEPDGLVICHHDGVAKLRFKNLPAEIQEKYKYSPAEEKDFLEKCYAESVKRQADPMNRSQERQTSASPTTDGSFVATILRNKLLHEKIKVATYNCEFIKKRIASIEQEIAVLSAERGSLPRRGSSRPSPSGIGYLKEELEKKKLELPIKEAILAKLIAERNPTPSPIPQSFFEKYAKYFLWSLLGLAGILLFLWKKN